MCVHTSDVIPYLNLYKNHQRLRPLFIFIVSLIDLDGSNSKRRLLTSFVILFHTKVEQLTSDVVKRTVDLWAIPVAESIVQ